MKSLLKFIAVLLASGSLLLAAANLPAADAMPAPQVQLQTNMGVVVVELYPDKALATVENFLTYVNAGFYDGTIFHRVIDGFMIQGGGFTADLQQKDTREPVKNEAGNGLKNLTGTIAMARTNDPHSASAQFFINVADNDFLDHSAPTERGWGYCVFGKVISGMDVVNKIKSAPTGVSAGYPDVPVATVLIEKASLLAATAPASGSAGTSN